MRARRLYIIIVVALVATIVTFGVGQLRSKPNQQSSPKSANEPSESYFGAHSYPDPPNFDIRRPSDSSPSAFTRDQAIAATRQNIGSNGQVASADLVIVAAPEIPKVRDRQMVARQWLVVVTGYITMPSGGTPRRGSACDTAPQPPSCKPSPITVTHYMFFDAESGELIFGQQYRPTV